MTVSSADAVLFCTPEYAEALPGSFKNLLDWLVGGGELYGMPVSSINVAATGRGQAAQTALRSVLSYLGAVEVEGGFVQLPITSGDRERDGSIPDPHFRSSLNRVLRALAAHVGGGPE